MNNLFQGVVTTCKEVGGEFYKELVAKGKKRMGQESEPTGERIAELIHKTRASEPIADLISRGKKGQEEMVSAIGKELKNVLSVAGIVTKTELAHLEKRVNQVERKATRLSR